MPLFEFQCPVDGNRFELLLPSIPDDETGACTTCGARSPLVWSLPVMRPDTMWAGVKTSNYGYVTSASQLKREMKQRNHEVVGDRTDREAWDKIADDSQKDKAAKMKKDVRKWSEKTFGPSGLGLGGADGDKLIKDSLRK
jgi:hypothetical protein